MTNPLLAVSPLKNLAPQFDLVKVEHFLPAVEEGIRLAKINIEAIKNNLDTPTFENTIEALESSSEDLDAVHTLYHNQLVAVGGDALQNLSATIDPLVTAHGSSVTLDDVLFQRVKAVYDSARKIALTDEQNMLLENTYKAFVRNGALLPADKKDRLKQIDQEMSLLGPKYRDNTVKARAAFKHFITDETELSGIPDIIKASMKERAVKEGQPDAWCATLDFPTYGPIMDYADNRALRETLVRAANGLCYGDAWDNTDLATKILQFSNERAQLLGYKTAAHYVLEKRMAEKPETVFNFLEDLKGRYKEAAIKDLEDIKAFAFERDGIEDLQPWDTAYYSEKLKEARYDFNSEELRPYFPVEKVLAGTFQHFSKLFGIKFVENKDYPVYEEEVKAYDVFDEKTGDFKGTFYVDLFPRPDKKSGAWATSYRDGGNFKGERRPPVAAICCNFTKSTADTPSLITHDEVTTLFHEMGHALHALLGSSPYRSLSGYNVMWDFVELPSQVQENWAYEPETLALISGHYQTGEPLPKELIDKMLAAKNFMSGTFGFGQLRLGTLDINLYANTEEALSKGLIAYEEEVTDEFVLLPNAATKRRLSPNFGHIFGGGYGAGYYSYKWAEVLDADAFEAFKETGNLYDQPTARALKALLSAGGSIHPADLYRKFRGRDADVAALTRREGLVANDDPGCGNPGHQCKCAPA